MYIVPTHINSRRHTSSTGSPTARRAQRTASSSGRPRPPSFSASDRARSLAREHPELFASIDLDTPEPRAVLHDAHVRTLLTDVAQEMLRLTNAEADGGAPGPLRLDAIVRCLSRVRGVEEAIRLALPPPPVPPRRHGRTASGSFSAGDFTPKRAVPSLPGSGEVGRIDSLGTQDDLSPHDPFAATKTSSDVRTRVRCTLCTWVLWEMCVAKSSTLGDVF